MHIEIDCLLLELNCFSCIPSLYKLSHAYHTYRILSDKSLRYLFDGYQVEFLVRDKCSWIERFLGIFAQVWIIVRVEVGSKFGSKNARGSTKEQNPIPDGPPGRLPVHPPRTPQPPAALHQASTSTRARL